MKIKNDCVLAFSIIAKNIQTFIYYVGLYVGAGKNAMVQKICKIPFAFIVI